MRRSQILRLLMLVCLFAGIFAEQCSIVPKCTCKIGDEPVEVSEQYTGSEALTGAVGALGSMAVTGGGFGVWYLIKKKKSNSISSDSLIRSDSDIGTTRRGYDGQSRPPNIYSASKNDNTFGGRNSSFV